MRGIAYAIAAIAAVGIVIAIASRPSSITAPDRVAASTASSQSMPEAGTLTLSVPEMLCPFACYPKVKETLENSPSVAMVELAPQKEEGVIDNRQVIVSYKAGFNPADAVKLLQKKGFADSEVVQ